MRLHIRHAIDVSIHCMTFYTRVDSTATRKPLKDLSEGGLCFKSHLPFKKGTKLYFRLPFQSPAFETQGTVTWCRKDGHYEIGVQFSEPSVDLLAMVGEACQIKHYTRTQQKSGRLLTTDQAASEWTSRAGDTLSDQAA